MKELLLLCTVFNVHLAFKNNILERVVRIISKKEEEGIYYYYSRWVDVVDYIIEEEPLFLSSSPHALLVEMIFLIIMW